MWYSQWSWVEVLPWQHAPRTVSAWHLHNPSPSSVNQPIWPSTTYITVHYSTMHRKKDLSILSYCKYRCNICKSFIVMFHLLFLVSLACFLSVKGPPNIHCDTLKSCIIHSLSPISTWISCLPFPNQDELSPVVAKVTKMRTHLAACPWGSMTKGHLSLMVNSRAFCTDWLSSGKPCTYHSWIYARGQEWRWRITLSVLIKAQVWFPGQR